MKIRFIYLTAFVLFAGFAQAQTPSVNDIIKQKIVAGLETKTVAADGIILYSQNVLPAYYESNGYALAWDNQKNYSELVANLLDSFNEGLNPNDYHLERLKKLAKEVKSNNNPEKTADLDLLMTDAILLYAKHLMTGKVDQSKIREGWEVPPNKLPENAEELLKNALNHENLTAAITSLEPDNFMYVHLRNGLNNYRRIAKNGGWPTISPGQVLKLDVEDARVIVLRKYLIINGDLSASTTVENESVFDKDVENAVKQFQFRHNLNQDGVIGKSTLQVINVPIEQRINEIRINMERARWVIHHLPKDFMVVNIAGYNVRRITNEKTAFYSRVIVGKHYHETPIFKGTLKYIEINPTWTLPYSIATKETLPKLQKDPAYLAKHNMIIMDRSGKELDPSTIDFNKLSRGNFPYTVRQKAGPHNALGQVKFIFPNQHAVYLHDTPARGLFAREERAFSHGCIRLDQKWELFLNLVGDDGWDMARINEVLNSGVTTRVNLKKPIEILLLYWTAGADKQDKLYFNKDVYDRDPEVLTELDKPIVFKAGR